MRVLQLGKFYPIFGGVEKVEWDLTKGLSASGVDCDMLCAGLRGEIPPEVGSFDNGDIIIKFNEHGRCIIVEAKRKMAATMIAPAMIKRLRQICNNYDIIHVHHPDPMACLALRMSGYMGRVVLHWHSDILKQKFFLRLYQPLQKWLINRADRILGTTPVYVRNSEPLADAQPKVDYLPIGITPVHPDVEGAARIRSKYPGKKLVYSLGRLVEYKGYEYLVDAAKYLPDDYHIIIGGTGPLKDSLRQQIISGGLGEKVTLLGYVNEDDFPAYYTACDIFCLSSIYKTEAFAIVQIEAMSCGKPIVATKIEGSGVAWVNKNNWSGINVKPKDSKALADAIMQITTDQQEYFTFCRQAQARFEEHFTLEKMIEKCIGIYKKLLK